MYTQLLTLYTINCKYCYTLWITCFNCIFLINSVAMYDQLCNLDTSKTTWRIKVRLTRMWPSVSSTSDANNGLKGYNLILLDDDVS